jgi:HEAT repeat protein
MSAARPEVEAREMSCALLDSFWRDHRKEVERLTLNLARDEDSEVRQYAASTMARIVRANFRVRFRYMVKWSRHADPSVRRQVIIATVGVADPEHPERAKQLLDLLEPHLSDRDPYVRRNLGPFALGHGMLRAYPEATLTRFRTWLESKDEVVRWNLAMGLAAVVAVSEWKTALDVLRVLAADQRRFVWGAASAALGNLVSLRSREVGPVLNRWMREPKLRVAVSSALRGIPS